MAPNNKQRRGKDDKTSSPTTTTTNSVDVQIQKAQEAVAQQVITTNTLHSQWRLHLLRLSYMVLIMSLLQWQTPITDCLYDVKSYNKSLTPMDDDSWRISGYKALHFILQDSFCEFLGFLMGIFLSLFLYQQHQQLSVTIIQVAGQVQPRESFFTHKLYMIATGMVPAMINLYINHRNKSIDMTATTPLSCLDQSSVVLRDSIMWERHGGNTVRGFPVVVLFHIIATGCCWFMDMQQSQQDKNILLLEKLRRDLTQAREENQAAKKKS